MRLKTTKLSSITLLVVCLGFWMLPWRAMFAQGAAHEITVSWTAPATVGGSGTIAGYNVYRSTTTGGPYTKETTTPTSAVSYVDSTGVAGTKYFYVITTVDSANNESVFSGEASATAIGNPNPPTGVQAVAK
jgi:fibronectin type 3 domain-containing protein